jgi:hypothetical protein
MSLNCRKQCIIRVLYQFSVKSGLMQVVVYGLPVLYSDARYLGFKSRWPVNGGQLRSKSIEIDASYLL